MARNLWFSVKLSGVGGIVDVVPMASSTAGGSVGSNARRREDPKDRGSGNTNCRSGQPSSSSTGGLQERYDMRVPQ